MINEVEEAIRDLFGETTYFQKLKAESKTEGTQEAVRDMTLHYLTRRFGELPETLVKRIETADAAWCQDLFDRAIGTASLEELAVDAQKSDPPV